MSINLPLAGAKCACSEGSESPDFRFSAFSLVFKDRSDPHSKRIMPQTVFFACKKHPSRHQQMAAPGTKHVAKLTFARPLSRSCSHPSSSR